MKDCPLINEINKIITERDNAIAELADVKLNRDDWRKHYIGESKMNEGIVDALQSISALIGNVDHSIGHGERSAKMRGGLLNDIRSIANKALKKEQS